MLPSMNISKVTLEKYRELNLLKKKTRSCLLPEEVLLLSVYPGLQQLSPLVTVEEILAELEDSFGEVVKFLDEAVLDLVSKSRGM